MATNKSSTVERSKTVVLTPLGIIAAFIALSETVAGLAAIKTEGVVQILFAVFAVAFPILTGGMFFAILWKRAYVLYPPQDFGPDVDVRHYVEAMRHQAVGNQELHSLVRTTISETLKSHEAQTTLSNVASDQATPAGEALRAASDKLAEQAVNRLEASVLTVDISEFGNDESIPQMTFPFIRHQSAFDLLSAVYFQISDHARISPHSYGKMWALEDTQSGSLILPKEVRWTDTFALADSGLTVEEMGLRPGMKLRAVSITPALRMTKHKNLRANARILSEPPNPPEG